MQACTIKVRVEEDMSRLARPTLCAYEQFPAEVAGGSGEGRMQYAMHARQPGGIALFVLNCWNMHE